MSTTPTVTPLALPQNPAGVTGQPVQNNSFYKAFRQLTNSVNNGLGSDVTDGLSDHALNTDYTTTKNILVAVTGGLSLGVGHTASIIAIVTKPDGTVISGPADTISNGSGYCSITFVVPSGSTYQVKTGGVSPGDNSSADLITWSES